MPKINFSGVPEAGDRSPIPAGQYLIRIAKVDTDTTGDGAEMYKLTLEVIRGPLGSLDPNLTGRLVWDNLVFSQKALPRAKYVLKRLGFNVDTGELELEPEMLVGKQAIVTVEADFYDAGGGITKPKNSIPYTGYDYPQDLGDAAAVSSDSSSTGDADLPF